MQFGAIDYWVNIFTPEAMEKYVRHNPELGPIFNAPNPRMQRAVHGLSADQYVALMDAGNVEMAFVPAARFHSYMHHVMAWDVPIEEVDAIVQKAPTRFRGLFGINPWDKMAGVRDLEIAVRDYGFVGAHLHTYGFDLPINDRAYWPFYAKCVELDVPIVMQTGQSGEQMPSALARPILIDDIALYFPELRVVGAHTGYPWVEELIAMARKHRNVFLGSTAYGPQYWEENMVRFIMSSRTREKALFGSDWPVLWYESCFDQIDKRGISGDARALFLRDNAIRVFKLPLQPALPVPASDNTNVTVG